MVSRTARVTALGAALRGACHGLTMKGGLSKVDLLRSAAGLIEVDGETVRILDLEGLRGYQV